MTIQTKIQKSKSLMKIKKNKVNLKTYTLEEHLTELKNRLLKIFFLFTIFTIITFQFSWEIFNILASPLTKLSKHPENFHFIYTKLTEGFMTELKISFISSLFLTSPVIFFQLYKFLEPGLYKNEKKVFLPYIFFPPILFIMGILIVYFIVMPITWKFFIGFQNIDIKNGVTVILEAKISEYIDLILELFIGFGLAFQLPILLIMLTKLGIINYTQLKKFRRYAIVLIFILAAILTPPDVFSQLILALPLVLLYEISILLCKKIK